MTLLVNDLYDNIIRVNASDFNSLRVITGYSSESFIRKVTDDFSKLKIELYVGMALQGICRKDHEFYKAETEKGRVRVHYVVGKPVIHQKVLEFRNEGNDRCGYIGSANFSVGGFLEQREVMVMADNSLDSLFRYAEENSVLCTDKVVDEVIPFVERENGESGGIPDETESRGERRSSVEDTNGPEKRDVDGEYSSDAGNTAEEDGCYIANPIPRDVQPLLNSENYIDVPAFRNGKKTFTFDGKSSKLMIGGVRDYSYVMIPHSSFQVKVNGRLVDADTDVKFGQAVRLYGLDIESVASEMLKLGEGTAFNAVSAGDVSFRFVAAREGLYLLVLVREGGDLIF